jgi:hypothetical protein
MILQWWNALVDWLTSPGAQALLTTVALPFAAILTAGLLAVLIARASSTRVMRHRDNSEKAAAIAGLLAVCRRVTIWTSLSSAERDHLDYQITESTVRLRLLPIAGADLAAEWSQLMITAIKRNSAALIDDAEKGLADLENGLILWYRHPATAKKQFRNEIAYLRMDSGSLDRDLLSRQRQWQATQDGRTATVDAAPAATPFGNLDELIAGGTPTQSYPSVQKAS